MNVGRRSALIGAAIGILGTGIISTAASASQLMINALPGNKVIVSGCVVRFSDPDGSPRILHGSHVSAGVESVHITEAGRLRVIQTVRGAAANPVVFAFAQADETLAGRGIMIGASGGTDDTEYVFYDTKLGRKLDLCEPDDRMRLQGKNSNCWLGWVHAPVSMR